MARAAAGSARLAGADQRTEYGYRQEEGEEERKKGVCAASFLLFTLED
jgi:hypothetical protein